MHSRIYIPFIVVFVGGLLWWALRGTTPLGRVQVTLSGGDTITTPPTAGTRYYFKVADTTRYASNAPWFWQVEREGAVIEKIQGIPVPPYTAPDTGEYVFRAYVDSREVARDTIRFVEGERNAVEWPSGDLFVGDELGFKDRSTLVERRYWQVLNGKNEIMMSGEDAALVWTPAKAGTYLAQVVVRRSSGDATLEQAIVVREKPREAVEPVRKEPRPEQPKPTPSKTERYKPVVHDEPKPEKPKDTPKPIAKNGECFDNVGRGEMTRAAVVKIPLLPAGPKSYDDVYTSKMWKSTGTVLEVTPERTCQLETFKFWGNNSQGNGDAKVTIECLEPECKGRRGREKDFIVSFDNKSPQSPLLRDMPVLRANYRYRITIKPVNGAPMGHFVLEKKEYAVDGVKVIFPQPESGVFDITFRVK